MIPLFNIKTVIIVLFITFLMVGCERGESGIDGLTGPTGGAGSDSEVTGCDFNSWEQDGECVWNKYNFPEDFDPNSLCTSPGYVFHVYLGKCVVPTPVP